jgi:hypothetical protein
MEEWIGRYLLPGEQVHHANCIKTDNRRENLLLFADSQSHQLWHAILDGRKHLTETMTPVSCVGHTPPDSV